MLHVAKHGLIFRPKLWFELVLGVPEVMRKGFRVRKLIPVRTFWSPDSAGFPDGVLLCDAVSGIFTECPVSP